MDRIYTTNKRAFAAGLQASTWILIGLLLFFGWAESSPLQARQPAAEATPASSKAETLPELQLEFTNAWSAVLKIVNQPVTAYGRKPDVHVAMYSPGWFHPGALTPDFNTVDVRRTQDLALYGANEFVTSDITPGIMYRGQDLEFNSMTKLFYTNRGVPKHKLSEAEMVEINRLYRILGRCRDEIALRENPVVVDKGSVGGFMGGVLPSQWLEFIGKIPRERRTLYGGIGIGALFLVFFTLRMFKRKEA